MVAAWVLPISIKIKYPGRGGGRILIILLSEHRPEALHIVCALSLLMSVSCVDTGPGQHPASKYTPTRQSVKVANNRRKLQSWKTFTNVMAENYMIFCSVCNKVGSAKAQSNQKRIVCKEVTAAALQQGRHDEVPARGGTAVLHSCSSSIRLQFSVWRGDKDWPVSTLSAHHLFCLYRDTGNTA